MSYLQSIISILDKHLKLQETNTITSIEEVELYIETEALYRELCFLSDQRPVKRKMRCRLNQFK